ncbi:Unknown protein [Striga hermonthica]|uniref:DUF7895 domain-containing protein n=1 Tax=Striga hermonthica TaxID=68872 RepID=A0A9N7NS94_STRHE|nr:Unknown protein [Striga hermonthica]
MQMELRLQNLNPTASPFNHTRNFKSRVDIGSLSANRVKICTVRIIRSLPETAASIAVAAVIVGTAATFLAERTKASQVIEPPTKTCKDCGGSGVCSECNGEGFVLRRLSDESAEKARLMAKNMATRYTAGLPKKWSYCTKCSSARSCVTCGDVAAAAPIPLPCHHRSPLALSQNSNLQFLLTTNLYLAFYGVKKRAIHAYNRLTSRNSSPTSSSVSPLNHSRGTATVTPNLGGRLPRHSRSDSRGSCSPSC